MPVSLTTNATVRVGVSSGRAETRARRRPAHAQRDAAALGELDRVAEQVGQDLIHAVAGRSTMLSGSVGATSTEQLQPLVVRQRREHALARAPANCASGTGSMTDLLLAGLDLGQVQHLVDQRQQILARRVDGLRELDLLLGQVAARRSRPAGWTAAACCSAACAARATCWPGTATCRRSRRSGCDSFCSGATAVSSSATFFCLQRPALLLQLLVGARPGSPAARAALRCWRSAHAPGWPGAAPAAASLPGGRAWRRASARPRARWPASR